MLPSGTKRTSSVTRGSQQDRRQIVASPAKDAALGTQSTAPSSLGRTPTCSAYSKVGRMSQQVVAVGYASKRPVFGGSTAVAVHGRLTRCNDQSNNLTRFPAQLSSHQKLIG